MTVAQYKKALAALSEPNKELLVKLYTYGPFLDTNDIAAVLTYKRFTAVNLQIGMIGRRICEALGIESKYSYSHKGAERPAFYKFVHDYGDEGWEIQKNLGIALVQLRLVEAGVSFSLPTEITREIEELYREGKVVQVYVNAFERSKKAREACLAAHGHRCAVCEFDFKGVYGNDIDDLIHVHHLKKLSRSGGVREVDPVKDLIPLCPNCHSVVHSTAALMSIVELKKRIKRHRTAI